MSAPLRRLAMAATIAAAGLTAQPAQAIPVFDAAVLAAVGSLNAVVTAVGASVTALLANIGLAVNQNGQKLAKTMEASARMQREFDVSQENQRRNEDARQRYDVPDSICTESGSGAATQVTAYAQGAKGALRSGGGATIANDTVARAINAPAVTQGVDAARAARIHAQYCDADDNAAYGGSKSCPSVSSTMPGADKRFDSLWSGAGPNGKVPDLTFSQEQTDAARMYVQNTIRRSIGAQLRKTEADTAAGAQYIGLMNQANAVLSAAADPQEQRIADSQPNPLTKPLLAEVLTAPSAATYFKATASKQAQAGGAMSTREFEAFEVGRRYANTAYQTDLQGMSGDNLLREQIRVQALANWLTLSLKTELQKQSMLQGMLLASAARQEFEPMLAQKYRSVPGR